MKLQSNYLHKGFLLASGCFVALAQAAERVDFEKEIKPILELQCLSCHGAEKPKGDLRLDTRANAMIGGENGPSIVVGKPEESSLFTLTVLPPDDDDIMPPKGEPLSKQQTDALRHWIEQGAIWPEDLVLTGVRKIDFVKDIQPILEFSCVSCHREGHADGDLRLDDAEFAFRGGSSGPSIIPGKALASMVYTTTVLDSDHEYLMPPKSKGGPLPVEQTDLLWDWINQGAVWPKGLKLLPRKVAAAVEQALKTATLIHGQLISKLDVRTVAEMKPYSELIPGTRVEFGMVPLPGGEFVMGSPQDEDGRAPDEGPQHRVAIEPFWMGTHEVTWSEYEMFMYPTEEKKIRQQHEYNEDLYPGADAVSRPTSPYVEMSFGMGKDGYPAISMTQHAANKYCEWLSAKTGHFYRLPTEAEWEYACRAGTTTAYSFGNDPSALEDYAWFADNSDYKYQKIGTKKPNPWGLYDMHGNVAEWTLDQYSEDYYAQFKDTLAREPWNKATRPYPHTVRGGSWDDDAEALRSAARRYSDKSWKQQDPQLPKSIWYLTDAQFIGFRVIRPLVVPSAEVLSKYWTSGVENE
jgi:formylglycine-generating enzyme required for sulfatase activity